MFHVSLYLKMKIKNLKTNMYVCYMRGGMDPCVVCNTVRKRETSS